MSAIALMAVGLGAFTIGYIFYVRWTTEQGVFWGIASGYGLGLASWVANKLIFESDMDVPAYFTTLVPLVVIPAVSAITRNTEADPLGPSFYDRLRTPG